MLATLSIQSVDPGRSIGWWADAGALLLRCPLRWSVLAVLLMAAPGLAALLPALGPYAAALLSPLAVGLRMQAAHEVQRGGTLNAAALRPVLRRERLRPLLVQEAAWALLLPLMLHTGYLSYREVFEG